ncbi:MAG TPA: NAD(P)H-dependent oxidoreductase [Sphingomicrobium sp.]|nr:NAD(P)H-dependent oxidoreductase [Sphingomicrobium sp.]
MRLLHIIASPRGERSRSRSVADHFVRHLGDAEVEELDLWAEDLPDLDGAMLESRYRLIAGEPVEVGFERRWDELRSRVDHLLSFDAWLFSTPMWNFGLPYRLKHYLDLVIQPTMAFTNDESGAITAHGADKIAILVGAGALDIRPDSALAALDFSLSHLAQCLRVYFGVEEVHEVRAVPTFGDDRTVEEAMTSARLHAHAIAVSLSNRRGARG